jgi:N6-L-threonylcarbamoyladenine synthase
VVDAVEDRIRVGLKLLRERVAEAQRAAVAANAAIGEALARFCARASLPLVAPPAKLCTDNGALSA